MGFPRRQSGKKNQLLSLLVCSLVSETNKDYCIHDKTNAAIVSDPGGDSIRVITHIGWVMGFFASIFYFYFRNIGAYWGSELLRASDRVQTPKNAMEMAKRVGNYIHTESSRVRIGIETQQSL